MRYYELHDTEYIKRLGNGQQGWDAGDYDDFFMKTFVERSLEAFGRDTKGLRALDLGCGTGALSCLLAERGFDVTGVDISPSAIAYALQISAARELNISFQVLDVCRDPFPEGRFDLVIDSHLLHCIVFADERQHLLSKIRQSLRPEGQFWMETMYLPEGQAPKPEWHLDDRGVVWHRHDGHIQCEHNVERDGCWWTPLRFIALCPQVLLDELAQAGLGIIEWDTYAPLEPGDTGGFQARCSSGDVTQ